MQPMCHTNDYEHNILSNSSDAYCAYYNIWPCVITIEMYKKWAHMTLAIQIMISHHTWLQVIFVGKKFPILIHNSGAWSQAWCAIVKRKK